MKLRASRLSKEGGFSIHGTTKDIKLKLSENIEEDVNLNQKIISALDCQKWEHKIYKEQSKLSS